MEKIHFDPDKDGFYGAYWKCPTPTDCAIIAMIGDDPEDYLAKTMVKWLHELDLNVMSMSPAKKDYGHHNYLLERIENAIKKLKSFGNKKISIVGASTTGTLALTAASYFHDITLTIGLTPSDFVWQGFMQGKKDGKPVNYYVYNVCVHEECYAEVGSQAISYTTGVPAMIGAMMVMTGKWQKPGVYNIEEFDPDPFMDALNKWGLPWKESFDPELVD